MSTIKLGAALGGCPLWAAGLVAGSLVLLPPPLSLVVAAIAVASPFAALRWLDAWPAHPGRHAGGSRSAPHAAPRRVRRDRRGAQPVPIVTAGRYHIRLPPDQLVIGDTK